MAAPPNPEDRKFFDVDAFEQIKDTTNAPVNNAPSDSERLGLLDGPDDESENVDEVFMSPRTKAQMAQNHADEHDDLPPGGPKQSFASGFEGPPEEKVLVAGKEVNERLRDTHFLLRKMDRALNLRVDQVSNDLNRMTRVIVVGFFFLMLFVIGTFLINVLASEYSKEATPNETGVLVVNGASAGEKRTARMGNTETNVTNGRLTSADGKTLKTASNSFITDTLNSGLPDNFWDDMEVFRSVMQDGVEVSFKVLGWYRSRSEEDGDTVHLIVGNKDGRITVTGEELSLNEVVISLVYPDAQTSNRKLLQAESFRIPTVSRARVSTSQAVRVMGNTAAWAESQQRISAKNARITARTGGQKSFVTTVEAKGVVTKKGINTIADGKNMRTVFCNKARECVDEDSVYSAMMGTVSSVMQDAVGMSASIINQDGYLTGSAEELSGKADQAGYGPRWLHGNPVGFFTPQLVNTKGAPYQWNADDDNLPFNCVYEAKRGSPLRGKQYDPPFSKFSECGPAGTSRFGVLGPNLDARSWKSNSKDPAKGDVDVYEYGPYADDDYYSFYTNYYFGDGKASKSSNWPEEEMGNLMPYNRAKHWPCFRAGAPSGTISGGVPTQFPGWYPVAYKGRYAPDVSIDDSYGMLGYTGDASDLRYPFSGSLSKWPVSKWTGAHSDMLRCSDGSPETYVGLYTVSFDVSSKYRSNQNEFMGFQRPGPWVLKAFAQDKYRTGYMYFENSRDLYDYQRMMMYYSEFMTSGWYRGAASSSDYRNWSK